MKVRFQFGGIGKVLGNGGRPDLEDIIFHVVVKDAITDVSKYSFPVAPGLPLLHRKQGGDVLLGLLHLTTLLAS